MIPYSGFCRCFFYRYIKMTSVQSNSRNNSVAKINFIQVCFCKTTNKLKLDIFLCYNFMFVKAQFSISLLSQHCAYGLVRLRHRSHLVRVRKTSLFGLGIPGFGRKKMTGNALCLYFLMCFFCFLLSCSKHSSPCVYVSFCIFIFRDGCFAVVFVCGRKSDGSGSR